MIGVLGEGVGGRKWVGRNRVGIGEGGGRGD